jgi:hypothetical protein
MRRSEPPSGSCPTVPFGTKDMEFEDLPVAFAQKNANRNVVQVGHLARRPLNYQPTALLQGNDLHMRRKIMAEASSERLTF